MKNKIGWCDMTWNPVVGCKNNCEYCYGKRMNQRFKFIEDWNKPEWKEKSFNKIFPKKSQRIFVGSMSEIYYWKDEWMEKVLEKIKQYPQHTFQFLTKFPRIYSNYSFSSNCWLGMTITKEEGIDKDWGYFYNENNRCFFSIEPFLDRINPESLECIDWVIIGVETGNKKGKVIPKREWIEKLVNFCKCYKIPVYLKDSLRGIYPVEIKEFPKNKEN
jgi:protein gp37